MLSTLLFRGPSLSLSRLLYLITPLASFLASFAGCYSSPSFLPLSVSLFECLVLLRCPPSPSPCLAFPHSIIILSLAPSVESLEWPAPPPLLSTVRSVGSKMLRVFFPLRTVEQKGSIQVCAPPWPSSLPPSLLPSSL